MGQDPCMPDLTSGFIFSKLNEELVVARVSTLIVPNQSCWDLDVIFDFFIQGIKN